MIKLNTDGSASIKLEWNTYVQGANPASGILLYWRAMTGVSITGASQANPCVIDAPGHGLTTGNSYRISEVVGMTELNDKDYTITVIDSDSFSLDGIDSTAYTAYSSGGVITPGQLSNTDNSIKLPIQATSYKFEGVAADLYYRFGIAVYKTTLNGMAEGDIKDDPTWRKVRPTTTPNFIGNIAGEIAATVKSNAQDGKTAHTGTTKYRSTIDPNAPTNLTVGTVVVNDDQSIQIPLTWTAPTGNLDGYTLRYAVGDDSSVTIDANSPTIKLSADATGYKIEGISEGKYIKVSLKAYFVTNTGLLYSSAVTANIDRTAQSVQFGEASLPDNVIVDNGTKLTRKDTGAVTLDDLDDGTSYVKTTPNQRDGGGFGYSHLDANGLKSTSKIGTTLASDVESRANAAETDLSNLLQTRGSNPKLKSSTIYTDNGVDQLIDDTGKITAKLKATDGVAVDNKVKGFDSTGSFIGKGTGNQRIEIDYDNGFIKFYEYSTQDDLRVHIGNNISHYYDGVLSTTFGTEIYGDNGGYFISNAAGTFGRVALTSNTNGGIYGLKFNYTADDYFWLGWNGTYLMAQDSFRCTSYLSAAFDIIVGENYKLLWSDSYYGSGADTNLYRSAADTLKTDDSLIVGIDLDVIGAYKMDGADIIDTNGYQTGGFKTRQAILFGYNAEISTNATYEMFIVNGVTNGQGYRMPRSGKITALAVQLDVTQGYDIDSQIQFKVYKNGTVQAMVVTFNNANAGSTGDVGASTTANAFTFVAGDTIMVKAVQSVVLSGRVDDIAIIVELEA